MAEVIKLKRRKSRYADGDQLCAICRQPYDGWGGDATPVKSGRCCDRCTTFVVIPARIRKQLRRRA